MSVYIFGFNTEVGVVSAVAERGLSTAVKEKKKPRHYYFNNFLKTIYLFIYNFLHFYVK